MWRELRLTDGDFDIVGALELNHGCRHVGGTGVFVRCTGEGTVQEKCFAGQVDEVEMLVRIELWRGCLEIESGFVS